MNNHQQKPDMVPSPCVGICALDEHDICIGCFRSGDEITGWWQADNEGKREILENVAKRLKKDVCMPMPTL